MGNGAIGRRPSREPGLRGIAFLGCGKAAEMHTRTLRKLRADLPLHYASRSAEKARNMAERLDGAGAFPSYEAALDADRVDVVFVVTPPARHLGWVRSALEAGKDVIVEKPAFTRSTDFDAVQRLCEETGRRVLVAENYVYKPLADALRRVFREETLGQVLFLNVNAAKEQRAHGWRSDPREAGGGALFEGGIHWVSLLAHLGPEVTEVRALRAGRGEGPERSMQVLLGYDQGAVASLSCSWEVPSPLKGLRISRIHGTEGSATFESNGLFFAAAGRRWRLRAGFADLLGYEAMFHDFLDALESRRPPAFTLADAKRDVELVEDAYRSAGLPAPGEAAASLHDPISRRR